MTTQPGGGGGRGRGKERDEREREAGEGKEKGRGRWNEGMVNGCFPVRTKLKYRETATTLKHVGGSVGRTSA